jgi:4-amino-4-deoxy-L-arabinose transferase-like glycosyltransferase
MRSAAQTRVRTQTLAVLGLALALRLLVLWTVLTRYPRGWVFTRGMEMGLLAQSIVQGHGLASPFGPPTGPTAFIAPGYPLLIAAVFRLFGTYSTASEIVVVIAQILLGLVTVWLMMHIARRLFGHGAAWLAGLIWAISLPILWIPTIFWDTSIAICLFTGFLALMLRLRERASYATWLGLGALCAVIGLINPAMLPALVAMLGWLAFQQRRSKPLGLPLAGLAFCVVFSPWPIRNAEVFHAFIPLRTTVGFELWMGNRPGADGFLDESLFPSFNADELQAYRSQGELSYTAHKSELAKRYIVSHPAAFVRLTAVRIARYWLGTGAKGGSPLFPMHSVVTTCLGFLGLGLLYRRRQYAVAILFALPLLLFPFPYYITHAEFRYRLALDPFLAILSAGAIASLFHRPAKQSATIQAQEPATAAAHG